MKFPRITGSVQYVDPKHYDDLIQSYVKKVSAVDGVLGIALFGSVTTPGLSDIDLIVTVPDEGPYPTWEQISLLQHAQGHPAQNVVAHDIFVWPQSVAQNAEAFFYVDQQTVLYGSRLGGRLDEKLIPQFKQLLTMDYLLHRFDSLATILLSRHVAIRTVLLFISTLRHTISLAVELDLLDQVAGEALREDINSLRAAAIARKVDQDVFDQWPNRIVELLWNVSLALGDVMGLNTSNASHTKWSPSKRKMLLCSNAKNGLQEWEYCINNQVGKWLSDYVQAAPVPTCFLNHLQSYYQAESTSATYLTNHFPAVFKSTSEVRSDQARAIRIETVIRHWNLLSQSQFKLSSGKGYVGVAMPERVNAKSRLLKIFAALNARRTNKARLTEHAPVNF